MQAFKRQITIWLFAIWVGLCTLSAQQPNTPITLTAKALTREEAISRIQEQEVVSKQAHPLFFAQSPNFLKLGLLFLPKNLYL